MRARGFSAAAIMFSRLSVPTKKEDHGYSGVKNVELSKAIVMGASSGISSIAALRGNRRAPSYSASKAYVSNYLEGLRQLAANSGKRIFVTDIKPGFIATPMAKSDNLFWVAIAEEAAAQIFSAICRKKKIAYITKRWRLIAWMMKAAPDWLYNRM